MCGTLSALYHVTRTAVSDVGVANVSFHAVRLAGIWEAVPGCGTKTPGRIEFRSPQIKGLDPKGRPIPTERNEASVAGQLVSPSFAGGTNWQNPAVDQAKGSFFVHATDGDGTFTKSANPSPRDIGKSPFLSSFGYN